MRIPRCCEPVRLGEVGDACGSVTEGSVVQAKGLSKR